MIGGIAANFHEGSRSEYLAQYIFASFGTAIPVPHQEDTGVDLYCTLTERVGRLAWPRVYFTVQVKSTMDAWIFDSADSVRWLVEHPLPLFLCIVDKSTASIRLYHTSPRFYVWSMPPLPERLELVPARDSEGKCTQWEGGTTFPLSAPILNASVQDLFDEDFYRNAREVLGFWISVDLDNLQRMRRGVHLFEMPAQYRSNSKGFGGLVTQGIRYAENIEPAMNHVKESLAWISSQLYRRDDLAGAARCAILLRHFFKDDYSGLTHDTFLHDAINKILGRSGPNYLYVGVDELNAMIDQQLTKGSNEPRQQPAG